ncbi:hypothetical protein [Lapillicoccus jejuensis]|uniref:Uncharacterized protein n=1 Tax=Lapillicoccus jejuensis TaxID=402171 RepID=A0A542E2V0_9MICO|nr:hypothetical protein [Lapillicoccus jejuensis]TQJ09657.1 hypothetical protein FB458_2770 [Lapillicoccus jejuensis]
MPLVRRVAVAVAALAGLVVAVLGLWLAVVLGPSGTATFTARATGPVVLGPDVLGALDVPVTVRAHTGDGDSAATGVFLGVAPAADVADVVGGSRVLRAVEARFPARVLDLAPSGTGSLADPAGLDVWATSARGSVDVRQPGSDAVLVAPSGAEPVTIVLERRHATWFLECLVAVVVGLIVAVAGAAWLVQAVGHRIPVGPLGARRVGRARPAPGAHDHDEHDHDEHDHDELENDEHENGEHENDHDDHDEHEEATR